jgi:hypothetical protein
MTGVLGNTVLVVDGILLLTLLEGVALSAYWKARSRGLPPSRILSRLLPGACLLLALRAALAGSDDQVILAWLGAAGLTHLVDLWRSWRR